MEIFPMRVNIEWKANGKGIVSSDREMVQKMYSMNKVRWAVVIREAPVGIQDISSEDVKHQ